MRRLLYTLVVTVLVLHVAVGKGVAVQFQDKGVLASYNYSLEDVYPQMLGGVEAREMCDFLARRNFSIVIKFKQNERTDGTLFTVRGRDHKKALEIESHGNSGHILIGFSGPTDLFATERYNRNLADGNLHELIVQMVNDTLTVLVDCELGVRPKHAPMDFIEIQSQYNPNAQVWIGKSSRFSSSLRGEIKSFTVAKPSAQQRCPQLYRNMASTEEKTTPQASTSATVGAAKEDVDYLKHRVGYLENQFKKWRGVVEQHEIKLAHVQAHQRGCEVSDGVRLSDGESWVDEKNCTSCICSRGVAHCHPIGCVKLACANPIKHDNQCCPVCRKSCLYKNKVYDDGQVFWEGNCIKAECEDGRMHWMYSTPEPCPELDCPESQRKRPPTGCCKVCENSDFCAHRPCHANATCVNERFDRKCKCAGGMFGNGESCFDIDECRAQEFQDIGGCGKGTRCINTPGSYRCECLPGYQPLNDRVCYDNVLI